MAIYWPIQMYIKWNSQSYRYLSLWSPSLRWFGKWAYGPKWLRWYHGFRYDLSKWRHGSAQVWRVQVFW